MEVMAKEQSIPFKSEIFDEGIIQFERNLKSILSKYRKHGIPVILSTVVSNEKDVVPFVSDTIPDLDTFIGALKLENPEAKELAQTSAHAAYYLGSYYFEEDPDTARKYLHLAKELDMLRFRAPEKINDIIVKLAQEYNASLVDMKSIFESNSENEVVGDNLMTEHVHPNIEGQFLMADAFYEKIKELDILDDWDNYVPFDEARNDIPVTLIDSLQGIIVIEKLKNSWPYNLNSDNLDSTALPERSYKDKLTEIRMAQDIYLNVRKWDDIMAIAYSTYESDKDYDKALHVAQSLIFEYPEQAVVYRMAGDMCIGLKDYPKAVFYYRRFNFFDKSSDSAEKLALAYLYSDNVAEATKVLSEAKSRGLDVRGMSELENMLIVEE